MWKLVFCLECMSVTDAKRRKLPHTSLTLTYIHIIWKLRFVITVFGIAYIIIYILSLIIDLDVQSTSDNHTSLSIISKVSCET